MSMDENQKREYLNRKSVLRYSGWKNYSPNVWTAMHWSEKDNFGPLQLNKDAPPHTPPERPSTAPPSQFGVQFNPKNEIPAKVDYLMETVNDLKYRIEQLRKHTVQETELIENLTDMVERLSLKQSAPPTADATSVEGDEENTEDINKENEAQRVSSSPENPPKKPASKKNDKNTKKQEAVIATYFAVNAKGLKSSSKQKSGNNNKTAARSNNKKPIKASASPSPAPQARVIRSNRIKRKKVSSN